MPLPLGIPDPLFVCELALKLALKLGMPVGEMCDRMSAWELNVLWPMYFARADRIAERERERAEKLDAARPGRK